MDTYKIVATSIALCAAVIMGLALTSLVRAAEVPGNPSIEDRVSPGGAMPMPEEGAPIDEIIGIESEAATPPVPPVRNTNELYEKTPDEVVGMDVIDVKGETVGTVDDLVVDQAKSAVSAVVAVDRLFGLVGGKKIVVPLDTLQLRGNELHIGSEKQDLKASPEYIKEYYIPIPVKDQRPIIDFLAFSDAERGGNRA